MPSCIENPFQATRSPLRTTAARLSTPGSIWAGSRVTTRSITVGPSPRSPSASAGASARMLDADAACSRSPARHSRSWSRPGREADRRRRRTSSAAAPSRSRSGVVEHDEMNGVPSAPRGFQFAERHVEAAVAGEPTRGRVGAASARRWRRAGRSRSRQSRGRRRSRAPPAWCRKQAAPVAGEAAVGDQDRVVRHAARSARPSGAPTLIGVSFDFRRRLRAFAPRRSCARAIASARASRRAFARASPASAARQILQRELSRASPPERTSVRWCGRFLRRRCRCGSAACPAADTVKRLVGISPSLQPTTISASESAIEVVGDAE